MVQFFFIAPSLEQEGLVRELLRRIQDLRKAADLDISDRIDVVYAASEKLAAAIALFKDTVMSETLAVSLNAGTPDENWATTSDAFGDETITIALKKA